MEVADRLPRRTEDARVVNGAEIKQISYVEGDRKAGHGRDGELGARRVQGTRGHESVVTIELAETPGGARLELTQEGFESERARDLHGEGWSSCLDCLEKALTEGAIA